MQDAQSPRPISYAEVPDRERDIPASLTQLALRLDRLEQAVGRLDPLIGPAPVTGTNSKDARTKCPLAERLDQCTAQINAIIEYVERVEI